MNAYERASRQLRGAAVIGALCVVVSWRVATYVETVFASVRGKGGLDKRNHFIVDKVSSYAVAHKERFPPQPRSNRRH